MCNAGDVLGHGSNKTSEADQMDILMSVTRDNLKRCIEGDIDGINEIDSKAFSASVKLDCYIQCNKTGNRPTCMSNVLDEGQPFHQIYDGQCSIKD